MITQRPLLASLALASAFLLQPSPLAQAATTINAANNFAYAANLGWLDWRGDTSNGAVIGEYVCSGYIYSANVGWISLGGGGPANGVRYNNDSATDFGVNHDGLGNLRGYAYGANIGWINFENTGAPNVDLKTGNLSGSIYSANCGWISLSNVFAHVQTDTLAPGADTDTDGLADAWEYQHFDGLDAEPGDDPDSDGASNLDESVAGTNPRDDGDKLQIATLEAVAFGSDVLASLTWNSTLTRCYRVEQTLDLAKPFWFDSGLGLIVPDGGFTSRGFFLTGPAPERYFRVQAIKPLAP